LGVCAAKHHSHRSSDAHQSQLISLVARRKPFGRGAPAGTGMGFRVTADAQEAPVDSDDVIRLVSAAALARTRGFLACRGPSPIRRVLGATPNFPLRKFPSSAG
jgi:hypothetical protein